MVFVRGAEQYDANMPDDSGIMKVAEASHEAGYLETECACFMPNSWA
jgi:hypothetical protein